MNRTELVNTPAEAEVLAALALSGSEALVIARQHLAGSDAFAGELSSVAPVVWSVVESGDPVSPATIRERAYALDRAGVAERAGEWYERILEHVGSLAGLPTYARIVGELARRRQLVAAAEAIRTAALDRKSPVERTVGEAITALGVATGVVSTASQGDRLVELIEDLERESQLDGAVAGVESGIAQLDHLTDGWCRGRLVVVAARPGCGKTAFGVWCAQHAMRGDDSVLFVSAEQPVKQIQRRRLSIATGLDLYAIRRASGGGEYRRVLPTLVAGAEQLRGEPFTITQHITTVTGIRLAVAEQAARTGTTPRLVVVDYLTKLRPEGRHDRHDLAVGQMSWSLARLAVEFDITVLLLAQLNRSSVEGGKVRRPTLADLRDSGSIEQDADQVLLLWPGAAAPDEHSASRPEGVARVEAILEKNRHGPTGTVAMEWSKATGRFRAEDRWARPQVDARAT